MEIMNRRDEIQSLLDSGVENGVSCGLSLSVVVENKRVQFEKKYFSGYCSEFQQDKAVGEQTVFDLASLTKPLVTTLLVANLVENEILTMNTTISTLLQDIDMSRETADIELWQLLSHCSGLPAHRPYYVKLLGVPKQLRADWLLRTLLKEPLQYRSGTKHIYSDLGYLLLGQIVERCSGKSLDAYFKEKIAEPLGLSEQLFFVPDDQDKADRSYAYTEICPWSHSWLCGKVDDDNCRALGGVAGHAGLFGTVEGVTRLCSTLGAVWGGRDCSKMISGRMLKKLMTRVEGSTWCYGFDSPSAEASSAGKYFSPRSVGHLGFTGTSFWMDLERGISVVLLTNRVHPSRMNDKIRAFRPVIHNLVMNKVLDSIR